MILPEGTVKAIFKNPGQDLLSEHLSGFQGLLDIIVPHGSGMILVSQGELIAAYFRDHNGMYRGKTALVKFEPVSPSSEGDFKEFAFREYNDEEFARAADICRKEGLFIKRGQMKSADRSAGVPDETLVRTILRQPGVLAVSVFDDGFPVLSMGDANFDQVSAMAEDLLRAGRMIAGEMVIGPLDQVILETREGKLVISPMADLSICVLASSDANLGLIRTALRVIQQDGV